MNFCCLHIESRAVVCTKLKKIGISVKSSINISDGNLISIPTAMRLFRSKNANSNH